MQQSRGNRRQRVLRLPVEFASRVGKAGSNGQRRGTDVGKKGVMPVPERNPEPSTTRWFAPSSRFV
jgi:hypothetical protein